MSEKASMATRKEIIARYGMKYTKAKKRGKGMILDDAVLTTGLSRSRIKHILSTKPWLVNKQKNPKPRPGRKPKYGSEVRSALTRLWMLMEATSK